MKKILIVYDSMMTGGTTTALLSLLNEIDYSQYSVDLLLFENTGAFFDALPPSIKVLNQAYTCKAKTLNVSKKKIILTLLNGSAVKAVGSYFKYRGTPKGNLRNILMHYGFKAQVSISRRIGEHYDCAIGFIEGWADQYVLSHKVSADKKIIWIHPDYENSYLVPEIDRRLFNKASYVVSVSEECKRHLIDFFPEYRDKIRCIENIISPDFIIQRSKERTPSIKKSRINLCTVARCDMEVKGLDRIISALYRLKTEGKLEGVTWHYIGDGRDFSELKDKIRNLGLEQEVICYGQKENPLTFLKQMDCFILTSRYEGKPVSVEEALALGIPCFVTEYASAKEQIDSGRNGCICGNNDESVYEMIRDIVNCSGLIERLKENIGIRIFGNEIEKLYSVL